MGVNVCEAIEIGNEFGEMASSLFPPVRPWAPAHGNERLDRALIALFMMNFVMVCLLLLLLAFCVDGKMNEAAGLGT